MSNYNDEIFNEHLMHYGFLTSYERYLAGLTDEEYFFPDEKAIEKLEYYLAAKKIKNKRK